MKDLNIRQEKRKREYYSAFTVVELLIIITVIALLATLTTIVLRQYLTKSNDGIRESNVTVLSEALEKYYMKHGTYLSCEQMTADPSVIAATTLIDVDQSAFRTPSAPEGVSNSVQCSDTGDTDVFIYQVTPDLLSWTITYIAESEDTVKVAYSRQSIVTLAVENDENEEPDVPTEPGPGAPDPYNPMIPNKPFNMAQLKSYCLTPENAPAGYTVVIGTALSDARGTEGNDYIYRESSNKEIYAYGGDDIICASNGNGDIYAGDGDNAIVVSQGNPTVEGGSGIDFILNSQGNGEILAYGGNDVIYVENGSPDVDGGPGDDTFYARNGSPEILGGSGWDKAMNFPTSNADYSSIEEFLVQ
jgi:Tfp pilus assembly protein PilE